MAKITRGMVFTNENCVGCNRCISGCPIPGANISIKAANGNRIEVDGNKCIHCGKCMDICKHDARDYMDDTGAFLEALEHGEKVSLLVAPSFYIDFPEMAGRILNALRKRGIGKIYNVSFGADIATWCYINYMKEHDDTKWMISQPCPAVVNYLEHHSLELIKKLIPIHSPMMCTAIYAEKYLGDTAKKAFLGPCIAKKDEMLEIGHYVDYNVTYRYLLKALDVLEGSDSPEDMKIPEPALPDFGLGVIYPYPGGLKECMEALIGRGNDIFAMSESVKYYSHFIDDEKAVADSEKQPVLIDALDCEHGCVLGPGVDKSICSPITTTEQYGKLRKRIWEEQAQEGTHYKERYEALCKRLEGVHLEDFRREYADHYIQPMEIPEHTLNDIFVRMHKTTAEKQSINCGSCGYQSCHEMAEAIALSYNRMENCVHYEKDENLRLYLTDTMTGIPNTNAFEHFVQNLIENREGTGYTAINFSLMDWELISDRYGYDAGNDAIVEFAKEVTGLIKADEMVARLGSIVFLAMIRNENIDEFLKRVGEITVNIEYDNKVDTSTVSICGGLYRLTGLEDTIGDVTSRINISSMLAKRMETSNFIYYDETMKEDILDSMAIVKSFPEAIENEEFVVYYQPKVSMHTLQLIGAEALVRWRTETGLVPPGRFIPIFEKNGIVRQLDFYVLDHVCKQIREWMDAGIKPVRISSNFSKQHFKCVDVTDEIKRIVDRWKIPHELIEIEFTETAYIDEHERLKETLQYLKEAGFASSIDDFGSGYSSLNLLQNLDFSVLKLDRAFLNLGASDQRTQRIIECIINMAKRLDMEVVAEGVERQEELEMLRKFSCDVIQGFYFDHPLPAEKFKERLLHRYYSIDKK